MIRARTFLAPGIAALLSLSGCTGDGDSSGKDTSAQDCKGPVGTIDTAAVNAKLGEKVTLTGAGTVCSGEPTLSWNIESTPAGSAIDNSALDASDPKAPFFTPDKVGTYLVSLTVADASGATSAPVYAVVTIASANSKPTANCGGNLTAALGARVDFDGKASFDPEGATLTYDWSLAGTPDCSSLGAGDIYNGGTVLASLVPDCGGAFVVGLVVSDGENWSDPAWCSVTVSDGNQAPVADAGDSEALPPCTDDNFQLDGYGSYDAEGAALQWQWSLVSAPAGSATSDASFSDRTIPNPYFAWDVIGEYTFQLQVYDGEVWSAPDIVSYTFQDESANTPPVANAGDDKTVSIDADCTTASYVFQCEDCQSDDVNLDGTASADSVDGDPISFKWAESGTHDLTIASPTSASTKIYTPTYPSEYGVTVSKTWDVQLTVSDCVDSATDHMTITYSCTGTYTP